MNYLLIGFILFLIGCTYRMSFLSEPEEQITYRIQTMFNKKPWIGFFRDIWFLGRTIFAFIILAIMIFYDWKIGLVANLILLITLAIEHLVKHLFNRTRPYGTAQSILLLQPVEPTDTSFPSGDTLRIWYLALIIPTIAGNSTSLLIGLGILALLVSLGRIVMGVHYLTDVLAGAGLGILGAGTTIWIWQLMSLL
jgi:undecaprenyl-diphosphatase